MTAIVVLLAIIAAAVLFAWGNDSSANYRAEKRKRKEAEDERDAAQICRDAALRKLEAERRQRAQALGEAEALRQQLARMVYVAADSGPCQTCGGTGKAPGFDYCLNCDSGRATNAEHVEADPAGAIVVPFDRTGGAG